MKKILFLLSIVGLPSFLFGQSMSLSSDSYTLKTDNEQPIIRFNTVYENANNQYGTLKMYESETGLSHLRIFATAKGVTGGPSLELYNTNDVPTVRLFGRYHDNHNGHLYLSGHSDYRQSTAVIRDMIRFFNYAKNQFWDIGMYNGRSSAGVDLGTYLSFQYNHSTVASIENNGNWHQWSDRRFKTKIKNIPVDVINKIQQLKPAKYEMKNTPGKAEYGFLAQNLIQHFPELVLHVNTKEEDHYLVNYTGMIPILTKAVQVQQDKMNKEDAILEQQLNEVKNLQAEVAKLSAKVKQYLSTVQGSNSTNLVAAASLGQNSPNPFNHHTDIPYFVPPNSQSATLHIYNISGQLLKSINIQEVGLGTITLQTTGLENGQYTYSLAIDNQIIDSKQMVVQH